MTTLERINVSLHISLESNTPQSTNTMKDAPACPLPPVNTFGHSLQAECRCRVVLELLCPAAHLTLRKSTASGSYLLTCVSHVTCHCAQHKAHSWGWGGGGSMSKRAVFILDCVFEGKACTLCWHANWQRLLCRLNWRQRGMDSVLYLCSSPTPGHAHSVFIVTREQSLITLYSVSECMCLYSCVHTHTLSWKKTFICAHAWVILKGNIHVKEERAPCLLVCLPQRRSSYSLWPISALIKGRHFCHFTSKECTCTCSDFVKIIATQPMGWCNGDLKLSFSLNFWREEVSHVI